MTPYSLRLDTNRPFPEVIKILGLQEPWMYCQEGNQENPHQHWYFESDVANATIRARIRKFLNAKGNSAYSLTQCDDYLPVKYFAYIMKQSNQVGWEGIPDTVINEAKQYDDKVKSELKEKKEKKKSKNLIKELEEGYIKWYPERVQVREGSNPWENSRALLRYITEYYLLQDKMLRIHQIQAIFDTLRVRHNPLFKDRLEDWILERYMPRN